MTRETAFVSSLVEDKCDPKLGALVKAHLQDLGLEGTSRTGALAPTYDPEQAFKKLETGIYMAFQNLGLDVERDPSIQDTPKRYAKMFIGELTKGLNYDFFPKMTTTPNGRVEQRDATMGLSPTEDMQPIQMGAYNQMVLVKNIQTMSLCEHHLQTIDGFTHIAYIPGEKVLGLSKFARVTEFFARRPQIQERMTEQIHAALCFVLQTQDVAVVQTATHFCMRARGAMQHSSVTTTDKLGGRFMEKPELRKEFFDAVRN